MLVWCFLPIGGCSGTHWVQPALDCETYTFPENRVDEQPEGGIAQPLPREPERLGMVPQAVFGPGLTEKSRLVGG